MRQPVMLALLLAGGCGATAIAPKPVPARPHVAVASIPGSFWEETLVPDATLPAVTFERERLVPAELADRFEALAEPARDRALLRGVLTVSRVDHERSLGAAYLALARKHVPFVITLDALFSIAFRAIESALDDVDRDEQSTPLAAALAATEERLAAESRAARSDTADAYGLARAVVAVARKLLDPSTEMSRGIPDSANLELVRIVAHAGPGKSPLLGRTLDYGAFDVQSGLAFGDARIAQFRAVTWITRAVLALAPEPGVDVATTRTQTRAAMLLSRATNDAWTRVTEISTFASGAGDDPGPRELGAVSATLKLDLRDEATIGNVVRVDHLRTAMLRDAGATVEDTGGSYPTFRLLSPSAPADTRALARLASASSKELPSALGVGLVLGSSEARTLLEADKTYDARTLEDIASAFATDRTSRHASLHASGLDAIATYLAPSAFDAQRPWRDTLAHKRRKLEVALAAWTMLRHADVPFARASSRALLDEPAAPVEDVSGAIEPHPETIARLVSLVRQARHGLAARAGLRETTASSQLLERVEALLDDALRGASAELSPQLAPPIAHLLASMPSRIAAIERRLGPAASPLVVVTAADLGAGRVLEDATGYVDDVWLAIDVAGAPTFFVGARIPFYERAATLRATDASWAAHLATTPVASPAWTEPYGAP